MSTAAGESLCSGSYVRAVGELVAGDLARKIEPIIVGPTPSDLARRFAKTAPIIVPMLPIAKTTPMVAAARCSSLTAYRM